MSIDFPENKNNHCIFWTVSHIQYGFIDGEYSIYLKRLRNEGKRRATLSE
jgi:hypothetical protein